VESKTQIINAIKEIASQQGGKPPGRRLFSKLSGIPDSRWYGRYWARWSDALNEAGLSANQLNERLDRHLVLDEMIKICRFFGRFPSASEVRLYGSEHPGSISHNMYTKHFGGRAGLIEALRGLAELREDLRDVLALLPTTAHQEKTPSETLIGKYKGETQLGYVYLLKSGEFFKIGRSDNIESRIKQISVALPDKVALVHSIETDDAVGIERYWHRRFLQKRANGEWFKLDQDDVRAFKRRRFQ